MGGSDAKPMVDPWGSVEIKDYEKLYSEFGLKKFPEKWKEIFDHHLFRRDTVVAHRDFERIVEAIENKKKFAVVTGIASSGRMHLGHKMIVDLTKFLKELGAKVFFVIADIDAYVSREKIKDIEEVKKYAVENIANVLALGLDKKDIYLQSKKEPRYYEFAFEISKKLTFSEYSAIYGDLTPGKLAANFLQYADILHIQLPEYLGPVPTVVPISFEQDPHIRATRDVARRLTKYKFVLPSSLYIRHQSGLKEKSKMSSSDPYTAIFLTDSIEEVKRKIFRAFTGGRGSVEEQRKLGGNPDICKVYEIFKYHDPSDEEVSNIYHNCKSGKLICGDCKKNCFEFMKKFLEDHQKKFEKYKKVAEKMVYS